MTAMVVSASAGKLLIVRMMKAATSASCRCSLAPSERFWSACAQAGGGGGAVRWAGQPMGEGREKKVVCNEGEGRDDDLFVT